MQRSDGGNGGRLDRVRHRHHGSGLAVDGNKDGGLAFVAPVRGARAECADVDAPFGHQPRGSRQHTAARYAGFHARARDGGKALGG
ncbi:hypothetical protein D3C86_1054100 [compost metagenome]